MAAKRIKLCKISNLGSSYRLADSEVASAPNRSVLWSLTDLKTVCRQAKTFQADEAVQRIQQVAALYKKNTPQTPPGHVALYGSEEELKILLFKMNRGAAVVKIDHDLIRFRAPRLSLLPRLPKGYGFKGGAARLALRAVLGEEVSKKGPRDLDIVRMGAGDLNVDLKVAKRFMADDFRHGHGVEVVKGLPAYFATRDMTVNEVLVWNGQVICSRVALADYLEGILRLTSCARRKSSLEQGKIMVKMLRLQAEDAVQGLKDWKIGENLLGLQVRPFDLALQLARALHNSKEAARVFVQNAVKCRLLKVDSASDPLQAAVVQLKRYLDGIKECEAADSSSAGSCAKPLLGRTILRRAA